MCSWSVSNIVINAHRKWIRFLEYHPNSFTEQVYINIFVNVFAIKKELSVNAASFYKVIHTVDGF